MGYGFVTEEEKEVKQELFDVTLVVYNKSEKYAFEYHKNITKGDIDQIIKAPKRNSKRNRSFLCNRDSAGGYNKTNDSQSH